MGLGPQGLHKASEFTLNPQTLWISPGAGYESGRRRCELSIYSLPQTWVNVRDPFILFGVWDSLFSCTRDPLSF